METSLGGLGDRGVSVKFGRLRAAAIGGALGFCVSVTAASADTFLFSFTDPNGTVGGQIILPGTGNYSGPPLAVILTTYPSVFDPVISLFGANATAWASGTITEINGQLDISSSWFFGIAYIDTAHSTDPDDVLLLQLFTAGDPLVFPNQLLGLNIGPLPPLHAAVGSPDITVTPTPLPAALPLFATGLGALGLLGWRRKRKAAAPAA